MNSNEQKQLKEILNTSVRVTLPENLIDQFLSEMDEVHYNTYGVIMPTGDTTDDIMLCQKGIMRIVFSDNERTTTLAFGFPGTIFVPWMVSKGNPSFYQYEACCRDTVILKMPRKKLTEYIDKYPEFAKWYIAILEHKLYSLEDKLQVINGDARGRFESLLRAQPEIVKQVPQVMVASYLHITPQYLSNIRKKIVSRDK